MVKYPFKFPSIAPNEESTNILYTGLYYSDQMTVRQNWGQAMYRIVLGHEIIWEVSFVGSDVKDFKKCALVVFGTIRDSCYNCKYCKKVREELCRKVKCLWFPLMWLWYCFTTSNFSSLPFTT